MKRDTILVGAFGGLITGFFAYVITGVVLEIKDDGNNKPFPNTEQIIGIGTFLLTTVFYTYKLNKELKK